MYANIRVVSVRGASDVGLLEVMRTHHNINDEASLQSLQLQVGKERCLTSTHILVLRLCVPPGEKQSGPPHQIRLMDQ